MESTGANFEGGNDAYRQLRRELRNEPRVFAELPACVQTCTDLGEFWSFIKNELATYQERREFLRRQFVPVISYLEKHEADLTMAGVSEILSRLSAESVNEVWMKALNRRRHDPDGAITAARTMLESVCKHILDDIPVVYGRRDDLPKLWRLTAEQLNLTAGQHHDPDIKAILGNCEAVVGGLANLRNTAGDAHGQGRKPIKPKAKHAELAVNLAGTMASFLVATWIEQSST